MNAIASRLMRCEETYTAVAPNAASVAGLLITTEAMVAERPERKQATPQMPDMGGMGGGMDF